jgi:hypothetical protein
MKNSCPLVKFVSHQHATKIPSQTKTILPRIPPRPVRMHSTESVLTISRCRNAFHPPRHQTPSTPTHSAYDTTPSALPSSFALRHFPHLPSLGKRLPRFPSPALIDSWKKGSSQNPARSIRPRPVLANLVEIVVQQSRRQRFYNPFETRSLRPFALILNLPISTRHRPKITPISYYQGETPC